MEQFYTFRKFRAFIVTVFVLLVTSFAGYSQLSGTYTVNPSGSATAGNYLTINDVCTDLSYGYRSDGGPANGSGSSGSVTIKIYDGTYNETPYLSYVSGSTGGGTITFQSNSADSSKVIIKGQTYYNYYGGVFTMYACDNIVLKQVTVTQDASASYYGSCVVFDGGSNYCSVTNCYLMSLNPATSTSFYFGSAVSAPFWSSYTPSYSNSITNNLITGGYYGCDIEGYAYYWAGSGYVYDYTITGNQIDSSYYNALNCISWNGPDVIANNKINMTTANNGPAMYFYTCAGASGGSEIDVYNNFIAITGGSGSTGSGIYTDYDNDYIRFVYNSINVIGSNSAAAAYFDYDYTSSCTVENNNFVNSGGGYAYWVSYSWGNPIGTSNYNNLYTSGSTVGSMDYSGLTALSDWQSYTGWDANSVSADPGYYSSTNLHATANAINNLATPLSWVTKDIDGQTRSSSTPDIGADEFTPVNDDAAVTAITNPTGNYCPGTQTIIATLRDAGVHTLSSVYLTYKVNGSTVGTYTWTGTLTSGSTVSVNVGTYSFTSGTYSVDVTSSMPNGVTDLNTANDHAGVSGLNLGLSGTKTIALTGTPDYSSFTAAATDLMNNGLCGAVLFNVGDGSYNEQVLLNHPIPNSSSTNTVTFQSNSHDSSKVILTPSVNYNWVDGVLHMENVSWVNFNQISTHVSSGYGYGNAVLFSNANHCTVTNGYFIGSGQTTSYGYGVFTSNYNSSYSNVNNNSCKVSNCRISQYQYGVYEYGYNYGAGTYNYDNTYTNNTVDSVYYAGLYLYYSHHITADHNTVMELAYPYGYATGLAAWYCDTIHVVGNKINPGVLCYYGALTLYGNSASSSAHGLVANNFVHSTGSSSYQGNAIYMYGNSYTDVVYNSTNVTGSTGSYALYDGDNSYNYNTLENNNLVHSGGGYACYAYSNYFSNGHNYNNFFTTGASGTNFITWDGSTYTNATSSFNSFKSSYGANSVKTDPIYNSASDLHAISGNINNKGTYFSAVTTDIDGVTRSATTPDIGANEFTPVNDDAGVSSITNPVGAYCTGTTTMTCVVKNYGVDPLSQVDIAYSVNGGTATSTTKTFTAVATGGTVTLTFGTYAFSGTTNNLVVWTANPNGATDGNNANDTSKALGLKAGVSGSKTIKTSGGDYTSFNNAMSSIIANGLCGSVVVTADDGVWNEQLSIPSTFPATAATTVTFQGHAGDSSKVILYHPADYNYSGNYALQFNGCQYVTFKEITISRANGYGYNNTVNFQNGASNNTVLGCDIKGCSGFSYNNLTDQSSSDTANSVISTRIAGNQYATAAAYIYYAKSFTFAYCLFDSGYYNNLYCYQASDLNVKYCTFKDQQYTVTWGAYYADLNFYYSGNVKNSLSGIIGNKFYSNGLGMSDQYSVYGVNSYPVLIANNFFMNTTGGGYNTGYYNYFSTKRKIVFNSFNITTSGGSNNNMYIYDYSYYGNSYTASITVENNSFSNTGSGYNVNYNNYWGAYATFNYNNYYFNGSYLGYYSPGGTASSFSTWQGYGIEGHGQNGNPLYTAANNLHAYGATLNNNGTPGWGVTTDIDGQTRSLTVPDIGADEFTPSANDAGITALIAPTSGYCAGTATIIATLANYGTNNLSSAILTWRVTGAATGSGTYTWTTGTPLTFGQSVNVSVGTYSFPGSGTLNVSVHSNLPNGATDLNTSNDSTYAPGLNPALGGTVTIAQTGSPNYSTFAAAVSDIQSKGLCGNLLVQVGDGIYNEQVTLGSSFPATASATVTFQGNTSDSTKVHLYHPMDYGWSTNYALQFNGCQYVTFENMTISRSNGYGGYNTIVNYQNGASNNTIKSCRLVGNPAGWGYTALQSSYSNDTANKVLYTHIGANYNSYDGCVYLYQPKGWTFQYDVFDSGQYNNFYVYYSTDLNIKNCVFKNVQTSSSYYNYADLLMYYCGNANSPANGIIGNLFLSTNTGILDQYNAWGGTNTYSMLIANNMFVNTTNSGSNSGYYGNYIVHRNIYNNSFNCTTSGSSSGALYVYDYSGWYTSYVPTVNIVDNCIVNTGGGYCLYYNTSGSYGTIDYNNYYFSGSNMNYFNYYGATSSLTAWQSMGYGFDAHGINTNPIYQSATNLHALGAGINNAGTPLGLVTTDFDGQTRSSTTPDIGADEFTPSPNDASISSITSPYGAYCAGSTPIKAVLTNAGTSAMTSCIITYRITGAGTGTGTYTWSGGPLASGDTTTVNVGSYSFVSGSYNVSVASSLPNGVTDGNPANDSTYVSGLTLGMGGTYTIAKTGTPNYSTFTAAISDLTTNGICGSVLFTVGDGVYNEQISVPSLLTTPTQTVTFQGNTSDSTKVILFHPIDYNWSSNYTLQFNGAKYFTFENMTITRFGGSSSGFYSTVVSFKSGASNNTIKTAQIIGNKNTASYGYPDVQDNSSNDTGNTFNSVRFSENYSGLQGNWGGSAGWIVTSCLFDSLTYYGIQTENNQDWKIIGNTFRNMKNSGGANIYLYYANATKYDGSFQVVGNTIVSGPADGIDDWYNMFSGSANYKLLIANNMIAMTGGSYGYHGIYTGQRNYYYNTIQVNNGSGATYPFFMEVDYSACYGKPSMNFEDNIFSNKDGGQALYYQEYCGASPNFDFNDYYTSGSTLASYDGTTYSNLSGWQSGTGLDAHSISVSPLFTSSTDLHCNSAAINNAGTPITGITTDIDGQTRSTTTPDIGADEFTPAANDASISAILTPNGVYCAGATNIKAVITNAGIAAISTCTVTYRVTGAASYVGTYSYSPSTPLASGANDTIIVGTYSFTSGSYNLSVASSLPNGVTDGNPSNDSTYVANMNLGIGGTKTIAKTGTPDYSSFGAAITALGNGICGSVLFQVGDGTYKEHIVVPSVIGANALNTITFQGNTSDSTKVELNYNSSTTYNAVLTFLGASYTTFDHITIHSKYYMDVVNIQGGTNNCTISHGQILGYSSNPYYYGVASYQDVDNYNSIIGNYFNYLGYGVYLYSGSSAEIGNNISNNYFHQINYTGISLNYQQDQFIANNNHIEAGYGNGYQSGIYAYGGYTTRHGYSIQGNYIHMGPNYGGYGLQLNGFYNTSSTPAIVANNMILIDDAYSYSDYAVYLSGNDQTNIVYNTIVLNGYYAYGLYTYDTYTYNYSDYFENNILVDNYGTYYNVLYAPYADWGYIFLDYNDYYTAGSNFAYTYSYGTYSAVTDWFSYNSNGNDGHSLNILPSFVSSTDLHISSTNPCALKGKATVLSYVTNDFDNDPRTSNPDIGADQYAGSVNGLWVGGISTDWTNGSNWCSGSTPGTTDDVAIGASCTYYPNISTGITTPVCHNIDILIGGSLTISGGTLTFYGSHINNAGTWSHSAGNLVSNASSGSVVCQPTSYFNVTANGGSLFLGNATVYGDLVLNGGVDSINGTTLDLQGAFTFNSGATLSSDLATSTLIFDGSGASTTLPNCKLYALTLNRSAGVNMTGDVEVGNSLTLTNGALSIGAHKLILDDAISATSGSLTGGTTSYLDFEGAGTSTWTIPTITGGLSVLRINRSNGLILGDNISVNDTLLLLAGTLDLTTNSKTLTLPNLSNIVRNSGSMNAAPTITGAGSTINLYYLSSVTTSYELPSTVNNIIVNAVGTVTLASNLTVNGNFTINSGTFAVGGNALSLGGNLTTTGTLSTTLASDLTIADFSGSSTVMNLPQLGNLHSLKVNRATGANIKGNLNIANNLDMTLGILNTDNTGTGGNMDTIFMASTASISNEGATSYVNGVIQISNPVVNDGTTYTFGNIGTDITIPTTASNPAGITVTRTTGANASGSGSKILDHNGLRTGRAGMNRDYHIVPTNNGGLQASLVLHYLDGELNGIPESGIDIYRQPDGGTVYAWLEGGTRNTTANTIALRKPTDSFSHWTMGGTATPLPVELTSFTVQLQDETSAMLNWVTASEINNDHFDIERSEDGHSFTKVGEKAGHGTTQVINKYDYLDRFGPSILSPVLYYRLKQVDYNGAFVYSDIKKVALTSKTEGVKVWYNRDIEKLQGVITVTSDRQVSVQVVDAQGKLVADQNIHLVKGNNAVQLDMHGFAQGVYTFIYISDSGNESRKFIKY